MTVRTHFREGRRLEATDLNRESDSREADAARHVAVAHSGGSATRPVLVGTAVTHPTGLPSVEVTPDGPASGTRFTLVGDTPALELGVRGAHHAAGDVTTPAAPVVVGALRLSSRPLVDPSVPWSMRALDIPGEDGTTVARELRIELAAPPGSPPSESRVAIGTVAGTVFTPALVIDAAGTVSVDGDLEVAGSVSQGEIPPDPADPRFVERLADVVARRVVEAATGTSGAVIGLTVTADDTAADETPLDITFTPTRALTHWGVALEVRRQGTSAFRLIGIGGPTTAGTEVAVETAAVPWSPPLTSTTPGRAVVAVVAFDAVGTMHGQSATTAPLTG
ncbi:MAG: hypothetical protein ABIQ15_05285 [Nocardioides sp.]